MTEKILDLDLQENSGVNVLIFLTFTKKTSGSTKVVMYKEY